MAPTNRKKKNLFNHLTKKGGKSLKKNYSKPKSVNVESESRLSGCVRSFRIIALGDPLEKENVFYFLIVKKIIIV